jgi:hypothetical protein
VLSVNVGQFTLAIFDMILFLFVGFAQSKQFDIFSIDLSLVVTTQRLLHRLQLIAQQRVLRICLSQRRTRIVQLNFGALEVEIPRLLTLPKLHKPLLHPVDLSVLAPTRQRKGFWIRR